jgi:hypothetical protein
MTGDRSRQLKVGTNVYWKGCADDRGQVVENGWSAVKIRWDNDDLLVSICHNDMTNVATTPVQSGS